MLKLSHIGNFKEEKNQVDFGIEEAIAKELDLKVEITDTVKAYYAKLPITDMSFRYMVQVLEPVALVASERKIPYKISLINQDPIQELKNLLLKEWHEHWKGKEDILGENYWAFGVNKVELIECDLLVPKEI